MGRRSFVSIHTRSTVPRDPPPDVYRGVRGPISNPGVVYHTIGGKGLNQHSDDFATEDKTLAQIRGLCLSMPSPGTPIVGIYDVAACRDVNVNDPIGSSHVPGVWGALGVAGGGGCGF